MIDPTPEVTIELLKAILAEFHRLSVELDIDYWLDGGSILGACREHDIISHDDDIDVGVIHETFISTKFKNLLDQIGNRHVTVNDKNIKLCVTHCGPFLTKISIPDMWLKTENGRMIGTPTLDVFCYEMKADKIRLASQTDRKKYKNCFYMKDELYPLQQGKLGEIVCMVPNNPLAFVWRYYGADCLEVVKYDEMHKYN